jgi:hypothetical protein
MQSALRFTGKKLNQASHIILNLLSAIGLGIGLLMLVIYVHPELGRYLEGINK